VVCEKGGAAAGRHDGGTQTHPDAHQQVSHERLDVRVRDVAHARAAQHLVRARRGVRPRQALHPKGVEVLSRHSAAAANLETVKQRARKHGGQLNNLTQGSTTEKEDTRAHK
jgi:hypothetical protein